MLFLTLKVHLGECLTPTTQALHWDRGRPARHKHRKGQASAKVLNVRRSLRAGR